MESFESAGSGSGVDPALAVVDGSSFHLDAELARLATLPLDERAAVLAELARRLEAELDSTSAPLQDD
ncbi:MAG: hypothetical protein ACRDJG_04530 [Actinomycetota bacterium]